VIKKIFVLYGDWKLYIQNTYYIIETFIIILCTKVVKYIKSFIDQLIAIMFNTVALFM